MTDRNSDQMNNALDRAEDILADNALQLAEMRQRLTQLERATVANTEAIDRLIHNSENNNDQITRINEAIDRTNGILERYITQMSIEKTYARGKLDDLQSRVEQRLNSLEAKLDEMERNSPN